MKTCVNVERNIHNLDFLALNVTRAMVNTRLADIKATLQDKILPFVELEDYNQFDKQFEQTLSRYKFFVLEGQSGTGKTVWSKWRLKDPSVVYYTNCAHCVEPDLRKLDLVKHKIILMDEASPQMAINQKLLMQAPPEWIKLGCSTTNMYSYDVMISGIRIIICSNTWTEDLRAMPKLGDRQWLTVNSFHVNIDGMKLWMES